jgi:FixJ family two-component response regulator
VARETVSVVEDDGVDVRTTYMKLSSPSKLSVIFWKSCSKLLATASPEVQSMLRIFELVRYAVSAP